MKSEMQLLSEAREFLDRAEKGLVSATPEGREHARVMLVEADRRLTALYHRVQETDDEEDEETEEE